MVWIIECDQIEPLVRNMRRIFAKKKVLTPEDYRDLENLLSMIEERFRKESHIVTMDDYR